MVLTQLYTPVFVESESSIPSSPPTSRGSDELRPIHLDIGLLSQASGSAYLQQGETKILCAVFGPFPATRLAERSITSGELVCDVSVCGELDLNGISSNSEKEKELSLLVKSTITPAIRLNELPKCIVHVKCLILEGSGGEFGTAICAASLALSDAGVPLNGLVTGCTVGIIPSSNHQTSRLILDPSYAEMGSCQDHITIAGLFSGSDEEPNESISQFIQSGVLDMADLTKAMELCLSGCRGMRRVLLDAMLTDVSNQTKI